MVLLEKKNIFILCTTLIEHWVAVVRKSFYSTAVSTAGTVRSVHQNTKHGLR